MPPLHPRPAPDFTEAHPSKPVRNALPLNIWSPGVVLEILSYALLQQRSDIGVYMAKILLKCRKVAAGNGDIKKAADVTLTASTSKCTAAGGDIWAACQISSLMAQ